jgi:hypothetical protein
VRFRAPWFRCNGRQPRPEEESEGQPGLNFGKRSFNLLNELAGLSPALRNGLNTVTLAKYGVLPYIQESGYAVHP